MGEIKSAWELAMEKVDRLGKLSPEELREQKEKRCSAVGRGLVEKYLAGAPARDLRLDLDKYEGEERALIRRAVASGLAGGVKLGDSAMLSRVVEALAAMDGGEDLSAVAGEIERLFAEYREAEEEAKRELDSGAREVLHQLRISGNAIGSVNAGVIPEWGEQLDSMGRPYRERLESLQARLAIQAIAG